MTTCIITLTAELDRPIPDDTARDVAASWAAACRLDLALTSTSRDAPWLRVAASRAEHGVGTALVLNAAEQLVEELAARGHRFVAWHALEALTDAEQTVRARHRGVPPLVDAQTFADMCGVRRQRVYQWVTDRPAGFPAQVVTGWWLRAEAEHWAATRPTRPGPQPARDAS